MEQIITAKLVVDTSEVDEALNSLADFIEQLKADAEALRIANAELKPEVDAVIASLERMHFTIDG